MTFKNKDELVTSLHIACLKKDFRLAKVINSRSVYCFKCAYPECKWWLRAVKFKSSDRFCIKIYKKYHTCGSEHITSHNPHATAKVLGKYFKNSFPNGKGPSTRDMTNKLRTELGCKVSYWKIYKGREIAKSLVRGTHEHGYGVLDAYRYMLESANPGSKTALQVDENGKFKYFFVAYAAWIQGFQQLRKVIAVDGTFLKSKYEGVLLSAVAQDAENHIFPVAFCVVDKECDASYQYFFEQMRSYVDDTDELCIISDRHSSIRKMVSIVYPSAHYGCYMRHLGENIRNNFHNAKVVSHFYNAAKAYNKVEFYDHFNQIRDMVLKAAEHLESVGFHRWSRAFCPENRYNIMTSNIAESVNAMFEVEREFPIVVLFDEINMRFAKLFHERRMELVNSPNIFVPSMEKQISKNINLGNKLLAHQIANYKFSINGHGDVATVNLQRRMCTCRVFDLDKIPCPHAMAALRSQYGEHFGNQIYEYSSSYYSVEKYIIAYCKEINPVPPEGSWIVPLEILEREIPPSYVDPSKPGRRRTKRRRGVGESFPTRKNKCSICKNIGHKRTTCPVRNAT
ncbi:uncharacterized protein LOC125851445 [Solanum stenotomum]|uniref:uncharacterized protein LOC125851445 n=1 Tax=Solanum stenotomum TaxID=172797 RepID=UPI0020D0582C|nr:uncharacterized protein LOC125851445 [Solanum stenotomum]